MSKAPAYDDSDDMLYHVASATLTSQAPKSLKLGPHTVTINFQLSIFHLNQEVNGIWNPNTMTISLNSQLASKEATTTIFLHELLHAIYWFFGLKEKSKEERVVDNLSTGLAMVYKDNPKLVAWINEGLR